MSKSSGKIKVIQIFNDSIIAKIINYNIGNWSYKDQEEYLGKDRFNQDVFKITYNIKSPFTVQELVDYLTSSTLFSIEDQKAFIALEKEKEKLLKSLKKDV